jgi:flagellar motor switch protein FliN/FliY
MTTTSSSYDWAREVDPNLKKLDSIPLTGATPPFPWEDFSARLAHSFDREGLTIQPGEMTWRTKDNLYDGLGDSPIPLVVSIPPLRGQVVWLMPAHEISILATLFLTKESSSLTFSDQTLSESFYRFLALEVLYNFTQVPFDKTLSPILINQTSLPHQDALCWDISLHMQDHTLWGRLIISPEFRRSWVEYFAKKQISSPLSQQLAQVSNVLVHLEAGHTQLTLAEWMSVQLGDFIILDRCSLDSERLEGRVNMTLNGKQLFRAKLRDGTLKILELPLLHEAETPMAKQPEDEDDFSDLDLPEDNDDEEDEEEDLFSDSGEDLFPEEDEEGEEVERETTSETALTEEESTSVEEQAPPSENQRMITPEQIPVSLVVEIGQVQMAMEQLLKLEPGNLLEINVRPEDGVNLTINGKMVGKGELIRIGEAIGVRILQLGH